MHKRSVSLEFARSLSRKLDRHAMPDDTQDLANAEPFKILKSADDTDGARPLRNHTISGPRRPGEGGPAAPPMGVQKALFTLLALLGRLLGYDAGPPLGDAGAPKDPRSPPVD